MSEDNLKLLKKISTSFQENVSEDKVYNDAEEAIKSFLIPDPERIYRGNYTSNVYSFFSNYLRYAIEEKRLNPNNLLMFAIKYTNNYIGLYLIGMLIRAGANQNVYIPTREYGPIHILATLVLRRNGPDPYFNKICVLLRLLGSDYNYPVFNNSQFTDTAVDLTFIDSLTEQTNRKKNISTRMFMMELGKNPDININTYLKSLEPLLTK